MNNEQSLFFRRMSFGDVHILVEKERFDPKELDWDYQSPTTASEGTSYVQMYDGTDEKR